MAKTAMKVKQQRKQKFSTREYTRCKICGRPHSVLRKYGICRLCFRELAYKGQIPGVKKASWQVGSTQRRRVITKSEVSARPFSTLSENEQYAKFELSGENIPSDTQRKRV